MLAEDNKFPADAKDEEDLDPHDVFDYDQWAANHPCSLVPSHQSPQRNLSRSDLTTAHHLKNLLTRALHAPQVSIPLPPQVQTTSTETQTEPVMLES